MIITKIALPRRTVLRGAGAMLALPFLDAMVPALSAKQAAKSPLRMGFFYVPNGVQCGGIDHFYPKGEGANFEMSRILAPVAPFRNQLTVVSGLSNLEAAPLDVGSGPHTRAQAVWLNGVRPKRTEEGSDLRSGITVDQYAARVLGKDTPLMSLELALEDNFARGNCEGGYSCTYMNTFSWRTPTMPLPMERNPSAVFERLFGDGNTSTRKAELRTDRSLLDAVTEDMSRLQGKLGSRDRSTVSEYLDAVRDVETRIQRTLQRDQGSPLALDPPMGIPDSFDEHSRIMFDMLLLAYQTDITRVVTFQIARELSARAYPQIGVPQGHHEVSHHALSPELMENNAKINVYHMLLFSEFLEKMRKTQDGDGSLLDHSMLLYGSGMSEGDGHICRDLPTILVGGGNGQLEGGRHVRARLDTPFMNLGLSLLDKVGGELHELKSIGDSTGRLAGI